MSPDFCEPPVVAAIAVESLELLENGVWSFDLWVFELLATNVCRLGLQRLDLWILSCGGWVSGACGSAGWGSGG